MNRQQEQDEVRRHIAEGERRLQQQREHLAELERDGHDVSGARKLLETMEQTQALHHESLKVLSKGAGWKDA